MYQFNSTDFCRPNECFLGTRTWWYEVHNGWHDYGSDLQADKPGSYLGRSANFSGEGFTHMEFEVEAKTKEKYDKWVKEVQETAPKLTEAKYNKIVKPGVVGRMTFSSHHLSYVDPKSLEYCDYNYYKNKK